MRSAEVQSVSDLCTYIKESSFVAASLLGHKDVPVIGKVLQKKRKQSLSITGRGRGTRGGFLV